jgi:mono/diheme cytochrome c family protein/glucose/arabinose dehydrogenase
MSRAARNSSAVVFGSLVVVALLTRAVISLSGQAPAQGAAAGPPTAEQMAPFVGNWVVTLTMMANQSTIGVDVKSEGGQPAVTVHAQGQPTVDVKDIAVSGKSLVLKYVTQAMNMTFPTVLTLTPDGATVRANMAVMDGQYEMSGSARKLAAGEVVRFTGFGGGGGNSSPTSETTDFTPKPPYLPRTPEEEAAGFVLPTGYRLELVASDPDVISPTVIEFDGNGRMYVAEMISYMMDAEATREHDPISRISRWESTKGDGHYDKHTIFADHLVAPRMILPLGDGVILTSETDSDDILKLTDTNGDGVADKREVVFTGIGQSGDANIEHQKSGLVWGLDNWIYTTYNAFRIRWTPSGFLRERTGPNAGQWGLGMDDDGKPWFVDAGGERGPMNFQYPIQYGAFTPCPPPAAGATPNPNCPEGMENGFEKDFAVVWPPLGIGDMQGGIGRIRMPAQNLNHFTAATGPAIVRGDKLPADLKGDFLFTEPVGRLIRRAKVVNIEGLTELRNAYPGSEFILSRDQLFRPVNISNAPDGTMYIADMYHGIIQEREWSGPGSYLRAKIEQYQLDKVVSHGRIWRLRYDGRAAVPKTDTNMGQPAIPAIEPNFAPPRMYSETPAQLVAHLSSPNGWWRDMAQRLLVLKQDKSVVPALEAMARGTGAASRPQAGSEPPSPPASASASEGAAKGEGGALLARFHAVWTLEGLNALDASLVRSLMKDESPRMRVQAIRASESLYKAGNQSFADDYRALTKDADPNVAIQAMLTINLLRLPDAADVITATKASNKAKGVALIADHLLTPASTSLNRRRPGTLTPEEEKRLEAGSDVYSAVCAACHGPEGMGKALEGGAPGAMMAPPLAGSPRVQGHRDYVIKVLLNGLTGPLGGRTYTDIMAPLGSAMNDEWVAGVASFVRSSFGNTGSMVTPADVARVRAATKARKAPWTENDLEASMPKLVDSHGWTITASHEASAAPGAATLRGWSSGAPQAPGMSLTVELPQPVPVTEIQFDSAQTLSRGRGGPNAGATPVVQYPRGYSVQVSLDGKTWSKPVATGKGQGRHTTIAFAPVRAKFVRITQTDTVPDAPEWSVSNLRIYQAP